MNSIRMKNNKILIIGGGSIGKRHIKNLQFLGYKNIFCLKRKHDKKFENKFNVKVLSTYQEGNKYQFDIIFICTPSSLHIDDLKFCFNQDSHIFIEKPMVTNQESYQYLKSLKFKKIFFIGFMLRYHPLIKKIKSFISNIENIFYSRFEFGSYLPNWPYESYKDSYVAKIDLGGGVINTICHEMDLALYFFGVPNSIFSKKINSNIINIEAEDLSDSIFSYKNHLCSLHIDLLQKDFYRRIFIQSKDFNIHCDLFNNILSIKNLNDGSNNEEKINDFEINNLYIDELRHFFELIKNNNTDHCLNYNYALLNTEMILKMHSSANNNKEVFYEE
tara:strand:+ start:2990 stop:3985 length:996 start_codon:yes stop_codon:yes gene_type:complete